MVEAPDRYDFVAHVTQFCRGLRDHGLLVGLGYYDGVAMALAALVCQQGVGEL